jgi:branched-chain amino acid transport system permease protein
MPVRIIGFTFAANRVLAFGVACAFGLAIWLILKRTRFGAAMRALAIEPTGARLVGVDTTAMSAIAFASGGALVAVAGTLVSTFLTFNPSIGVEFTMKALVVVMMGGIAFCSAWPKHSARTSSIPVSPSRSPTSCS